MSKRSQQSISFCDGVPFSVTYHDVYYSKQNGLAESRHVFLHANKLLERWHNRSCFTIAETGFGTGLNFLATWDLWKNSANRPGILHYISVELHPLRSAQLVQCHAQFPELRVYSRELVRSYPTLFDGFHRLWFEQHQVCLTLCFGDVRRVLTQISGKVDTWFLDGFAPAKNPAMWSSEVFRQISRLSRAGTTMSTFTAARIVCDGALKAGFKVNKIPGYGKKRHMISGCMEYERTYRESEPWFKVPKLTNPSRQAIVIGAGIAGAQAAWHLAKRDWHITVLERHRTVGTEASGNPMAVISPKITARTSVDEEFSVQCFLYLLRQIRQLKISDRLWSGCGVLNLAMGEEKLLQWQRISQRGLNSKIVQCLSADEASNIAGIQIEHNSLYYPEAGWIDPRALIRILLSDSRISIFHNSDALRLSWQAGSWSVIDSSNALLARAPVVVIASGRFLDFDVTKTLPVTPVLGQTTLAKSNDLSRRLKTVVQHTGYITPEREHHHLLGSTYDRNVDEPVSCAQADQDNFEKQRESLHEFSELLGDLKTAHAAVRTTSPTRMPYIGVLPNETSLRANYRPMLRRNYQPDTRPANHLPGLYITAAYGSRGITNAALGGELLASIICDEPLPIQSRLYFCLHPSRQIVRDLKTRTYSE